MTLGELIHFLECRNPDIKCAVGFTNPHSYRGYYQDLAFEPNECITVRIMLEEARIALGQRFIGYKGSEFKMYDYTTCWLAEYGRTGEGLGEILLKYMVGEL